MNMCKPGDAELSYQSLRLEQGNRLGRKWRMASKKESMCKGVEYRSLRVNFRASVT